MRVKMSGGVRNVTGGCVLLGGWARGSGYLQVGKYCHDLLIVMIGATLRLLLAYMGPTHRYIKILWYDILKRCDGVNRATRLESALLPSLCILPETAKTIRIQQRGPIAPGQLLAVISRQDFLASAISVYMLSRERGWARYSKTSAVP